MNWHSLATSLDMILRTPMLNPASTIYTLTGLDLKDRCEYLLATRRMQARKKRAKNQTEAASLTRASVTEMWKTLLTPPSSLSSCRAKAPESILRMLSIFSEAT